MSTLMQIWLSTAVPAAVILLSVAVFLLADVDDMFGAEYEPPDYPVTAPFAHRALPVPAWSPPPRPVLIVDGHLGVLEVGSPPAEDAPIYYRLHAVREVAEVRELVTA